MKFGLLMFRGPGIYLIDRYLSTRYITKNILKSKGTVQALCNIDNSSYYLMPISTIAEYSNEEISSLHEISWIDSYRLRKSNLNFDHSNFENICVNKSSYNVYRRR